MLPRLADAPLRSGPGRIGMRLFLWVGFGGLLALLSFVAVSALSVVSRVEIENDRIRSDYLQRARVLEQLRSDIYLSGTYVRDFLLENEDWRAESYRKDFSRARKRIEEAIGRYQAILRPEEAGVFSTLTKGISAYFDALEPALEWNAAQRRILGRSFMREEVLPRRTTMISIAGRVGEVNERQLEAGNVQISRLFAGFRTRLITLSFLTLFVGMVLAAFSMQRIFKLEQETQERYREVEQARREAQRLSTKLVDAQEEERRRISRELHDEIGQALSALLVGIGNLNKTVPPNSAPTIRAQIGLIRNIAEGCVSVVRNMSLLLRPSMLDDLGLVPALEWQARETSRSSGMRVSVVADTVPENLPDEYKTSIYRIVQEALHNSVRHAKADNVRIQLQYERNAMSLSIQDDGRGFPTKSRGLGLLGIEERVRRLGGTLSIDSEQGGGTLLSIILPKPYQPT
jgi:signal transduction histidine kinase